MPGLAIPTFKFVGTVSLGLFTGISYATSTQSLPSLIALPSAASAHAALLQHHDRTSRHLFRLAALAISSYTLAFALSPRGPGGGRHPYLILTSLTLALGEGLHFVVSKEVKIPRQVSEESFENISDEDDGVNGEAVERAIQKWRVVEAARAAIGGLAFAMGVIGLWGDGVRFVR